MVSHKELRWAVLGSLAVALALGCGDSTGPAVLRNNPGTGTGTMLVIADIEANDEPAGFVTDFDVSLRDTLGAPISGATVTVRNSNLGTVTLSEEAPGTGDYFAQRFNFAGGDYRLDVVSGTDNVQAVVVGGIAGHTILEPLRNDTIPVGDTLLVRWTVPSQAVGADVESREYQIENLQDTGSHRIPGAFIQARPDERIRVWRFNRVDIAGGLAGSRLKLSVRNSVEPVIVQ